MPPEGIDSLNADSLKGLVLSLLGKIDEGAAGAHRRTRGASRQAAEDADELVAAAIERTEGQHCGCVGHEENPL